MSICPLCSGNFKLLHVKRFFPRFLLKIDGVNIRWIFRRTMIIYSITYLVYWYGLCSWENHISREHLYLSCYLMYTATISSKEIPQHLKDFSVSHFVSFLSLIMDVVTLFHTDLKQNLLLLFCLISFHKPTTMIILLKA